MAKKITEFPSASTLVDADLIPMVVDTGGAPTTKKITFANLVAAVAAAILDGSTGRTVTVAAVDPVTGDSVTLEFEGGMLKNP
jgi:hypothetical protein